MNGIDLMLVILASRLTPMQTDCVIDQMLCERTIADIAAERGVSPAAISASLGRAKQKMREAMVAERLAA